MRFCYAPKISRPLAILTNLLIFFIILSLFFSLSLSVLQSVCLFNIGIKAVITDVRDPPQKSQFPVCVDNLLDQRDYHYADWAISSGNNRLTSNKYPEYSCWLLRYTTQRAVACIDFLSQLRVNARNSMKQKGKPPKLHFIFMGDSRMRQQFFYFLKLIPDYDRITNPTQITSNIVPFYHGDVDVDSSVLRLRVSFKWRPTINDTVLDMIRNWTVSNRRPNLILLSMEIYHMMQEYGADFQLYQKTLRDFAPILGNLANVSKVIWLNQYPAVELYGDTNAKNTDIHTQKIFQYNEAVRRIYENYSNIRIWDSSNPLTEEYVRGCQIHAEREYPNTIFIKNSVDPFINCKPYINCLDFIHTGYVALSQATQMLYNDICNSQMHGMKK